MQIEQPGMDGLSELVTLTMDDGSTITYDDSVVYDPANPTDTSDTSSTPATDLPVVSIPAGSTPPPLNYDPGQLIRAGAQIYRYIRQGNTYVPQPYTQMPTSSQPNMMMLLLLAGAAFVLLS